jgi:hypothetical protein
VIINWTDPFVRATIGIMSSSDAAPLPRLGEVFFDVRGDSRTMRLSWYADTGIAVFSIWQGGRCTGTFRLPIDDLARMTEILQRGPQRRRGGGRPDHERSGYDPAGYADPAGDEQPGYHEASYDEDWFDEGGNPAGGHGAGEDELTRAYADRAGANRPPHGRGAGEDELTRAYPDRAEANRPPHGRGAGVDELTRAYPDRAEANRRSPGQDSAGYDRQAGYADSAGYERSAGYADFQPAAASDATGHYEFPGRAVRPDDGSYLPGTADHDSGAVADLSRYGQERFVPPYVPPGPQAYPNDNPAAAPARRHGAGGPAYAADQAPYDGSDWPPADPGVTEQYSAGRHGGRRARSSAEFPFGEPEPDAAGEPISERDYWSRQAR